MYILDFLKGFPNYESDIDWLTFEYRLLSSGVLYNGSVLTTDWSKSDATRILFRDPFKLIVCSNPFIEYPQELSLEFSVPRVTESVGNSSNSFYPDEYITADLSALLTLLNRRLITVGGKVREKYQGGEEIFQDWPIGIITKISPVHWEYKNSKVIFGPDGVSEIIDYNPPHLAINPERNKRIFSVLAKSEHAESIIISSRLYSHALQYLETDIDRSYQLLISSIEALASQIYTDYSPSNDAVVNSKRSVYDLAIKLGLTKDEATEMALEASKGISWSRKKFEKFIIDYLPESFFEKDDLFEIDNKLLPEKIDFENTIKLIYSARSKLTHRGSGFPPSADLGIGPKISLRTIMSFDWQSKPFPPIVWFERLVNLTINNFIDSF